MESSSDLSSKNMAVLCTLAERPDGGLRVVLDDVRRALDSDTWAHERLFTYKDYAPGNLDDVATLSEAELAEFGFNILVRLLASNGHGAQ
jgi:hypothetical protein